MTLTRLTLLSAIKERPTEGELPCHSFFYPWGNCSLLNLIILWHQLCQHLPGVSSRRRKGKRMTKNLIFTQISGENIWNCHPSSYTYQRCLGTWGNLIHFVSTYIPIKLGGTFAKNGHLWFCVINSELLWLAKFVSFVQVCYNTINIEVE